MNTYMLTVLLKSGLDDKTRSELLEGVKKNFDRLDKEDFWGERDLAYPIKHQQKAYYAHFEFSSGPKNISSLDKSLKLNEDILRYLIVKSNGKP